MYYLWQQSLSSVIAIHLSLSRDLPMYIFGLILDAVDCLRRDCYYNLLLFYDIEILILINVLAGSLLRVVNFRDVI